MSGDGGDCGGHDGGCGGGGDGFASGFGGADAGAGPFVSIQTRPPEPYSVNGAPVIEQSHEYVVRTPAHVEARRRLGISLEGSMG
jgi:hypothetical protein